MKNKLIILALFTNFCANLNASCDLFSDDASDYATSDYVSFCKFEAIPLNTWKKQINFRCTCQYHNEGKEELYEQLALKEIERSPSSVYVQEYYKCMLADKKSFHDKCIKEVVDLAKKDGFRRVTVNGKKI